tara:strand:- start:379 stop:741 length:363 start_codon:yes stop_codon:yes gene_type:complete
MTIKHEFQLNKGEAVKRLNPDIQFTVSNIGTDDEVIEYLDPSQTPPSSAAINAELEVMTQELPWNIVRAERDSLLEQSDYVMMPDYPLEDKSAWESYRQELRDLPASTSDPDAIVFPEKP